MPANGFQQCVKTCTACSWPWEQYGIEEPRQTKPAARPRRAAARKKPAAKSKAPAAAPCKTRAAARAAATGPKRRGKAAAAASPTPPPSASEADEATPSHEPQSSEPADTAPSASLKAPRHRPPAADTQLETPASLPLTTAQQGRCLYQKVPTLAKHESAGTPSALEDESDQGRPQKRARQLSATPSDLADEEAQPVTLQTKQPSSFGPASSTHASTEDLEGGDVEIQSAESPAPKSAPPPHQAAGKLKQPDFGEAPKPQHAPAQNQADGQLPQPNKTDVETRLAEAEAAPADSTGLQQGLGPARARPKRKYNHLEYLANL